MSDTTTVIITPDDLDVTVVLLDDATIVVSSGEAGPQGPAGIYIGPLPPTNTSILWVDTS